MAAPVCVVTGVGPGNGASFTRKFCREGYRVAMLARSAESLAKMESAIDGSLAVACDVGDRESVTEAFARVRRDLGPVEVLVHNAGNAVFGSFLDVDDEAMESAWRVNTLGLFRCGREAVADMQKAGKGNLVVIGATSSLRGGAAFAAFASAKAAQRSLAQSMARAMGPQGIHVSYVIVDGVIDMPRTRAFMKDRPDDFFLQPDDIADTVFHLVQQPASAWTFELDLRPFGEKW